MAQIPVDGTRIYVQEAGQGPAIFLIHGSGSDASVWGGTFGELSKGHRVIAYDRRGFRHSHCSPAKDWHQHGEDAASLLVKLNAAPATVVGWSGGGLTALDLAANHPDLISSLVLVEPPLHVKTHMTMEMARTFIKVQIQRRLQGSGPATRTFLRWATSYTTGGCAFDRMPEEMRRAMIDTADATMGDLDAGTGEQISVEQVAALPVPVTCLLGDLTRPTFVKATQRILAAYPQACLVTIAGAGHASPFDRPTEFLNAVREAARASSATGRQKL